MTPVVLLELNEVALPYLERYLGSGLLPNFAILLKRHGYTRTESESVYDQLEPWIQWVTVHSGLKYKQHGIFRLGDILHSDLKQIYELLEERGIQVGAVSPMNAANRLARAAFFVPDPWTGGKVSGPADLKRLYLAIAQAVNDNAQGHLTLGSFWSLLTGFLKYSRLGNWPLYFRYALGARSKPWGRALFLDCLLADVFLKLWRTTAPNFSSLFLNGAAHIQHHYFFSSTAYEGNERNPDWYVKQEDDPLRDVYELYDRILGVFLSSNADLRLIVATGLSQEPSQRIVFYYRLRDHENFLRSIKVPFRRVLPRMSRDFLVECDNENDARQAEKILLSGKTLDGTSVFEVDNRGASVFVTLSYPNFIEKGMKVVFGNVELSEFDQMVAFVAIKNSHHIGTGYLVDTGLPKGSPDQSVPLASVFDRILTAFSKTRLTT